MSPAPVSRAAGSLKFNPPLGQLPALQYLLPQQLQIDPAYQRQIDTGPSQSLIRKIAVQWNWDLCQPLVVARRENGDLFVIDGQHRLAAAVLRGDIAQLPAVVVSSTSPATEAANFVQLNQQRRPLNQMQLFHAALAAGDDEAAAIAAAVAAAGLAIGRSFDLERVAPMTRTNTGGLQRAWRQHGAAAVRAALELLAAGLAGQRLKYAGTIFPGLVAVCADELARTGADQLEPARFAAFSAQLGARSQHDWRAAVTAAKASDPNMSFTRASAAALRAAWAAVPAAPAELSRSAVRFVYQRAAPPAMMWTTG